MQRNESTLTHRFLVMLFLATFVLGLAACGGAAGQAPDLPLPAAQTSSLAGLLPTPTPEASLVTAGYTGPSGVLATDLGLEARLIALYQQANPAVVYVIAPPLGSGSGFVYDAEGHIVTNNHVVDGARTLEIVYASGERRTGVVIGADADSDLAVIQVENPPATVGPLPLAAAGDIAVGQFVVAIGNPFGEQGSMSLGIVSGLGRSLPSQRAQGGDSSYTLPSVIQTDAPINPGNSGGPLLNLDGQVVGVNAAIASATGASSGVGFSIPVAALHRIVPGLIAEGRYVYPYLGAGFDEEVSLAEQAAYGLAQTFGTYIVNITPGSPADQAGLVAANPNTGRGGDLIVAIDGQPVGDFQEMNSHLVFHTEAGQTIQVSVLRGENALSLPLTLGRRP